MKPGDLVLIECNRFTDAKRLAFSGLLGEHATGLSVDDYLAEVLIKDMIVTIQVEYLKRV